MTNADWEYFNNFFHDFREPKDELRVFEIGARSRDLGLSDKILGNKKLIYREIHSPWDDREVSDYNWCYQPKADYHQVAKQRKESHKPDGTRDILHIPWYVEEMPYPFEENFFDEVHCHMITACFLHSERELGRTPVGVS